LSGRTLARLGHQGAAERVGAARIRYNRKDFLLNSGALMATKHIGILTGGGDVPGLNSVIKGVVYRGSEIGYDVIGIRRGWEGLTHVNLQDPSSRSRYILPLTRDNTRTIDRTGGTFLHTSRTNPSKMKSLPDHLKGTDFPKSEVTRKGVNSTVFDTTSQVLKNLEALQIDYLIAIGGDDTLSYAARLHREGVKVIAIPKTMDNDVRNTEYCIGFSTAITRATDAIERQRTTVGSHERIGVFRVFGRDAGYTALYTAYVSSLRCCIPEYRFDLDKLIDLLIKDKRSNPSNYSLVVLSEGAEWEGHQVREYGEADAYGHRKKANVGEDLSEEIKKRTGEETVISDLTYELRSGEADFVDKMIATTYGNMAMDCLLENCGGVMMAIQNGCYARVPIPDPKLGPRQVDIATMYNTDRYRPNYAHKAGIPIFLTRA
jgi:6-phosphofructokinase 1